MFFTPTSQSLTAIVTVPVDSMCENVKSQLVFYFESSQYYICMYMVTFHHSLYHIFDQAILVMCMHSNT